MLIGVVHVLRLPAYGPMYIVFRLLPLMFVWVLLFWCCLAFFGFACLAACAFTFTSCLLHWRLRSPCRARLQRKKKKQTPTAHNLCKIFEFETCFFVFQKSEISVPSNSSPCKKTNGKTFPKEKEKKEETSLLFR